MNDSNTPTAVRSDPARAGARIIALLAIACATSAHGVAHGATIYRQNFAANAGMTPFGVFGWNAVYGNATTNATVAPSGSTGPSAMVSGGPSAPTPGANVNAATDPANTTNDVTKGFVPLLSQDGAQDFLVYTTAYPIDRTTTPIATFQWYDASYYAGDAQRLAVQVGGNWYAQATSDQPPAFGSGSGGQGFGPAAKQVVAPFSTGGWLPVNFAIGTPLTLGTTSVALPAGTITGFGIYAEINNDPTTTTLERTFFDTFEVTTAPEPAALAAVGGAAIALTRRGRRR